MHRIKPTLTPFRGPCSSPDRSSTSEWDRTWRRGIPSRSEVPLTSCFAIAMRHSLFGPRRSKRVRSLLPVMACLPHARHHVILNQR